MKRPTKTRVILSMLAAALVAACAGGTPTEPRDPASLGASHDEGTTPPPDTTKAKCSGSGMLGSGTC